MDWYRIRHTIGMCACSTAVKRAEYLKKHNIMYHVGDNCMTMFRKIPLYPNLISLGNNVWIASQVSFVSHDVIYKMLNNKLQEEAFCEHLGCIDIKDNVFIGSNTTILPNVTIGPNVIVGAGSLVNRSLKDGVYAGVPAKFICSFEDFMNKRRRCDTIPIIRSKRGLSDTTIENYWKMFRDMEEQSK